MLHIQSVLERDSSSARGLGRRRRWGNELVVSSVLFVTLNALLGLSEVTANEQEFNSCWSFHLGAASGAHYEDFDDSAWQSVRLPHSARVENLVTGASGEGSRQWQGICWYRKKFQVEADISHKVVWLKFEAAMGTADVWLNGQMLTRHHGGYLPIVLDISEHVKSNTSNVLAIRLNNFDNAMTGPKPLAHLDFNFYGGLYREAKLIVKDRLHVTDPILADKSASGGVFARCTSADQQFAELQVQTHVANTYEKSRDFVVRTILIDSEGNRVATHATEPMSIESGTEATAVQSIQVESPRLWSPASPYLYTMRTELLSEDRIWDTQESRVGLRRIEISADGLRLNGRRVFLRGTNRHQEYPYIGYAMSDNAQYRDARKIKDAGFDYVRLSHYPHSPAFLDACDELGLMVMNCVMGWQYYSELEEFQDFQFRQARELIRRDRNHPCVLMWEVSLNESPMTKDFSKRMHEIAHEEYPGDQCFTCGWNESYDVKIQARQHGGCKALRNRPCVVSEYGDWEYYAHNAGFAQDLWEDLAPGQRNSRQDRTDGEQGLLQQVLNFQEAHNDNLKTTAFADGLWVMFDYNRGYSSDLETSGCMDIFRLEKPAYYFFKSQRDVIDELDSAASNATVYIANRWTSESPLRVKVFSNCDQIALYLNGQLVSRQSPDTDRFSTHLAHPPFTFELEKFVPGTLLAKGFIDGEEVQTHLVRTPAPPIQLNVEVVTSGRAVVANDNDVVFVHAHVTDESGVLVGEDSRSITFRLEGDGELIGQNPMAARAGTASILYRAQEPGNVKIIAIAEGVQEGATEIEVVETQALGEEECVETKHELARTL